MMDVIVRKAELRDIDAMVELLNYLLTEDGGLPIVEDKLRAGIKLVIESDIADYFVAEFDGRVAGMCCLHRFISSVQGGYVGVVEDVVVFEEYKGRGIANKMMSHMEKFAKDIGLTRLSLQVLKDNDPAISLYKKHNWEDTGYLGFRKYI